MSFRRLFDRLNRVKNVADDLGGAALDFGGGARDAAMATPAIVAQARRYLDDNAGGLESLGQSTVRALVHGTNPSLYAFDYGLVPGGANPLPAPLRYTRPHDLADVLADPAGADVANIGHQALLEPALALGRYRPGRELPNPVSGENTLATQQDIARIKNPLLRGGANALLAGASIATDPRTYIPTSDLSLGAQLLLGSQGIGGFGGESVLTKAARALVTGGAMHAGSEAAGAVTGDNPLAQLAGGLLTAVATHRIGSATPGLRGVFAESPIPSAQVKTPLDFFKSPAALRGSRELGLMDERITALETAGKPVPLALRQTRDELAGRLRPPGALGITPVGAGNAAPAPQPGSFAAPPGRPTAAYLQQVQAARQQALAAGDSGTVTMLDAYLDLYHAVPPTAGAGVAPPAAVPVAGPLAAGTGGWPGSLRPRGGAPPAAIPGASPTLPPLHTAPGGGGGGPPPLGPPVAGGAMPPGGGMPPRVPPVAGGAMPPGGGVPLPNGRTILAKMGAGVSAVKGILAPGTRDDIIAYDNATRGEARLVARNERKNLEGAAKTWDQQVQAGAVTETPARRAYVDGLVRSAVSPEAAARIQQHRLNLAVVREDPTGFDIRTPAAQRALTQADNAYLRQERGDLAAGALDPAMLQENYQNRVWQQPPPVPTGGVPRRPGAPQSFQKGRTFDNFLEGMAQGYEPASMDVPSLLEHRVQAGYTARAQKTLLDSLRAEPGAIASTPRAGYVELSRLLPRGSTPTYVREDVAQALDNYFQTEGVGFQRLGKVLEVPREAVLGMDLAMPGRVGLSGFTQTAFSTLNPLKLPENLLRGAYAAAKSWKDATVGREGFLQDPVTQAWSRHMTGLGPGDTGDLLARTEGKTVLQRIPVLGPTGKALEDWQFGAYVPAAKVNYAQQIFRSRGGGKLAPEAQEALREQIGRRVDTVMSGIGRARAGTTRNQETLLRAGLLSPAWVRGAATNITDLFKPGVQGDMARSFWVGFAGLSVASAAGLTAAFQRNLNNWNAIETLLDPRSEDSVTNPRGKNFLKVVDDAGNRHDLWGPLVPIIRSILRVPATAIGEGAETYDAERNLRHAVVDGLTGLVSPENSQALRDWAESRQSIPLGLTRDLAANSDFRGRVITNAEGNQRWVDKAAYAGASLLPGVAQAFLSNEASALPELGVNERSITRGAASFLGENFTPGPNDPAPIQRKASGFLEGQGLHGGVDPVGALKRAAAAGKLPGDAYQRFLNDNPDVTEHMKTVRQQQADNRAKPVGADAANEYSNRREAAATTRDATIKAAAPLLAQGDGKGYRAAVSDAWTKYIGATQNAAQLMWGTTDLQTAQQYIDKAYGGKDPSSIPVNQAFDEYESMQAKDDTVEARDAMLEARRAYLAPGGRADQQFGKGMGDRLRVWLRDRYQQTGGTAYAQYFDAQQVMGQFAEIPAYRLMDAPAARRAQTIVQRAQDAARYGLVPKAELAVLTDTRADPADRLNALRILKHGSSMANPERRWFLRDPANARTLMPYYSSVLPELYQQAAS